MKKMNTAPISGMQEFLPETLRVFDDIKAKIAETYRRHGFIKIETPIIDRCEILLAKAGGDTEKQIYKVVKTAEASDGADQALRFDHTVPLARYTVEHENDLAFPFKVCQIGRNFRGERPQKGRFRELYQCDVDVIGRGELPLGYDADVIVTLVDAYRSFLDTEILARVSNRKILAGLTEWLGVDARTGAQAMDIIDHSEKVPPEKTAEALTEIGLSEAAKQKVLSFIEIHGGLEEAVPRLRALGVENATFDEGVRELEFVLAAAESGCAAGDMVASTEDANGTGGAAKIHADMKIVRGLDYYTGTVFEFCLPEYAEIGSVGGGGRYENLAGHFTDQKLPGVGGSIGLSRLFYVLNEHNLLKSQEGSLIDYAVVPITEAENAFSETVAGRLRAEGKSVAVVYGDKRLGDKLRYAAKLATSAIVIGENEVKTGQYQVKVFE